MRSSLEKNIDHSVTKRESPSALWILQLALQTKIYKYGNGSIDVTDNFYTRHKLAQQLIKVTDGEMKMIGTVRLNLVDGVNRVNIKEAQGKLKDSERGHWALCEVYNAENDVALWIHCVQR